MKSWMKRRRDRRDETANKAANEISCIDLVELLTEYLEGSMAAAEAERLDAHLAKCSGCTSVLVQFREVIRLAGRLGKDAVARLDATRREPLVAAFREWAAERT